MTHCGNPNTEWQADINWRGWRKRTFYFKQIFLFQIKNTNNWFFLAGIERKYWEKGLSCVRKETEDCTYKSDNEIPDQLLDDKHVSLYPKPRWNGRHHESIGVGVWVPWGTTMGRLNILYRNEPLDNGQDSSFKVLPKGLN